MKLPVGLLFLSASLLLAAPMAHAVPSPLRLHDIPANRFVVDDLGQRWLQRGVLTSLGEFKIRTVSGVLSIVTVPDEALNRTVISLDAWSAFVSLDEGAVGNFVIDETRGLFTIGLREYYFLSVSDNPRLDLGDAVNLSTRGRVASGEDPLIGGFVVENHHRWVLIRGVGPALAPFGIGSPVADPYIVVYKNGSQQFQLFNDNWGQRFDADVIEQTAARIGAFPLERGSKDAAYLVELPPGAYTVHLGTDGAPGTGLLEIYIVP